MTEKLERPTGTWERQVVITLLCGDENVCCGNEYFTCGGWYVSQKVSKPVGVPIRQVAPA